MNTTYAGFWLRLVAYIIDYIIIYVVQSFIFIPVLGLMGITFASKMDDMGTMSDAETMGMVAKHDSSSRSYGIINNHHRSLVLVADGILEISGNCWKDSPWAKSYGS